MIEIEKITDNIGDCIEECLQQLNANLSQVDIQVMQYGLFKKTKLKIKLNHEEQSLRRHKREQLLHKQNNNHPNINNVESKDIPIAISTIPTPRVQHNDKLKLDTTAHINAKHITNSQIDQTLQVVNNTQPQINLNMDKFLKKGESLSNPDQYTRHDKSNHNPKGQQVKKQPKPKQVYKNNIANDIINTPTTFELSQEQKQQIFDKFLPDISKLELLSDHPVVEYLSNILQLMHVPTDNILCYANGKDLYIQIDSIDVALLSHRGEILDSLEILAHTFVNRSQQHNIKLTIDSQDYRHKRLNSLLNYVCKTSDKVVKIGRKIKLEPMSDINRKFVHTVLELDNRVFAKSEGQGNNRTIVIFNNRESL
ncbi:MAG: hypothetical protein LBK70_03045 [Clostridiales bacterium]|jgi:predicted RNA-binding protein Jag|nr:hypothetical protein [Clostridiales bacterium]